LLAGILVLPAATALANVDGAIFTTTVDGTTVNGNIYDSKDAVYLNGGPQNQNSNGLPDGDYYFQVTDPSGATLLSTDDIGCRQVTVAGGRLAGASGGDTGGGDNASATSSSCRHANGTFNPANGSTPVQLIPYNDTPNPGGEYKAWLTPVGQYNKACPANHGSFGFCDQESKTDNFKVRAPQAAYVIVCKFNDANGNGVKDPNEPRIPHWPVTATGVDGGTVTTQMNDDGCVSFAYSGFTSQHQSQTVTLTEGTFGPDWTQTAPADGTNGAVSVASGVITVVLAPGDVVTAPSFGNTNPFCTNNCPFNDLVVTKTAFPRYDRTFHWTIAKDVDRTIVKQAGIDATFTYTVTLTHDEGTVSGVMVAGTIRVSNPGGSDIVANVSDAVDNGGSCEIGGDPAPTVPAGSHVDLPYVCTYPDGVVPDPGTNTAYATWVGGAPHGSAPVDFGGAAVTLKDDKVSVTDTQHPLLGAAQSSDANPKSFTYSVTLTGVAGTCRTFDNTASFTTNTTQTTGSASREVELCVGRDLTVSKTATAAYNSAITKDVDKTRVQQPAGGSATFNYTVTVTESGWTVTGAITVMNPNDWEDIAVNLTDTIDNGGLCNVPSGTNVVVPRSNSVTIPYSCSYATAPTLPTGLNSATATWDAAAASTPDGTGSGTASFSFAPLTVTDSFAGGPPTTLGVIAGNMASTTFPDTRTVNAPRGTCITFDNVARIVETNQSAPRTVTVCGGLDLRVNKTAVAAFDSAIVKNVDKTRVTQAGTSATFTYAVVVTESGWRVSGNITVANPNDWEDITANLTDAVNNGGLCTVPGGLNVVVLRSSSVTLPYSCSYAAAPSMTNGFNTATATWDSAAFSTTSGTGTGTASFGFSPLTVTDSFAGGPPTTLGVIAGNVTSTTLPDTRTVNNLPAGTCSSFDNLATIVETNQSATRTVTVCVGLDLRVSKTAVAAFGAAIVKNVDKTRVEQAGGSATFTYTVVVTESGWNVSGSITVANPNDWEDITANLTDAVNNGGSCTVTGGLNILVLRNSSVTLPYNCSYAAAPSLANGFNLATATWDSTAFSTTNGTGTGTALFGFAPLTVTDSFAGGPPTVLGPVAGNAASTTFTETRTVNNAPTSTCLSYNNTATIVQTNQSSSQTITICNTATGANTMGFWRNKNGQGIITGGASTGSVCNSGTWLQTFAPFQDLSPTATCSQVAAYATALINAANAGGATMNAMLKGQMLATAFDVYFSDPGLGGNPIAAPGPIGNVTIDLTAWSGGFGGASSMTVSQMLAYAASQSNAGGTIWYGQVKATQEFSKDAFDAVNNEVAFVL
jgi:hypothetical protein